MTQEVGSVLSAGQRAQLLAIQSTSKQSDDTSVRLATGLKVNSALDNPDSFFVARSLRSRADDLTRLLDGIGQNIRVVEEAETGLEAGKKILDVAESYLIDLEKKILGGEDLGAPPPSNETQVTFSSSADLIPYIVAQDNPSSGTITTTTDSVTFEGNYWRRKAFNYNVRADTTLKFDFKSTDEPEIVTIGFDNDQNYSNDNDHFFIYGTQSMGTTNAAPVGLFGYTGAGAAQSIEIPIGQYFTGSYSHITFVEDNDVLPYGNAAFANIVLRDGAKQELGDPAFFQNAYEKILGQLDLITEDAHYRGVNLLKGDTLTTYFNPDRTNTLLTQGIDATFAGLGLETATFNSLADVQAKILQVRAARDTLRTYASTLAVDLSVITIRNDFTRAQINTSKAGANDLTLADLNEEGAKQLALQTRQQIQTTVLALPTSNILSVLT